MRTLSALLLMICITLSASAQDYLLRLNVTKGQHYSYTNGIDMNMTMTITGQDVDIKTKMNFVYDQSVRSVTPEGNIVMEFSFTRISMDMSGSGNSISYDTDKKTATKAGGLIDMSKVCDPLIGKKFTATMTPLGKVTEIKGLKELQDTLASNLDAGNAQMLRSMTDADKMTKSLESSYGYLPATKVKIGDKWTQKTKLDIDLPINIDVTYTLKEVKGNTAKIEYTSTYDSKNDNYENGGIKMKIAIKGTMGGKCNLDIKTGVFDEVKSIFNMKGTMEAMGTEIPMSADGTQESKLIPLK